MLPSLAFKCITLAIKTKWKTNKQTAKGKIFTGKIGLTSESSSRPQGMPMKCQKEPTLPIKVKLSAESPPQEKRGDPGNAGEVVHASFFLISMYL